ncbi:four helix bundle protein [Candidatus Uhrbacteria bacterium]|nr:four helix bundle protein [Candidatus Uhrbacteria bacterium]
MPVLQKLKTAYLLWFGYCATIPKTHRYTLGNRIDQLFIETIEAVSTAGFLSRQDKLPYVRLGIRKLDTAKILLLVLWESKSLDNKKYIALSRDVDEVGRMLGGWHGQLTKQNPASSKEGAGK